MHASKSPLLRPCTSAARLLLILLLIAATASASIAQDAIDAAAVSRSIDRGVAYLRKSQNDRGGWNEYGGHSCGLSALCTLAMLNAGVSRGDPDMLSALRYLRTFQPNDTYSVALQTLVFCEVGAAGDLPRIRRNVRWLIEEQKTGGDPRRVGSWAYGSGRGSGDPSNAQFALLALGAAVDRGIEVDPATFERAVDYWKGRQLPGGGWSYGGARATGSMTCAGIASIIIGEGRLPGGSSQLDGDTIRCCGDADAAGDPVEEGLEYLGSVFSVTVNPGGQSLAYYYYMYALERVGRLSGRRFIGGHDWYREGAEELVERQDDFQGFWSGTGPIESNEDIATAFALLFLGKGKRQVVVGQLRYGDEPARGGAEAQWQQHPDALRQLVRHVQRDWGRDLTWQTVEGERAGVADLLQTPVLIIRGRDALDLSDALAGRLKEYVDQGGCLLFEASGGDGCGDASAFEASVRELTGQWFPGAPLERLPPEHPVWYAQHKVDPAPLGEDFWVYGVQACCRTAVFYVPKSLSCRWELSGELFYRSDDDSAARKQIQAAVGIGENVIAYATGRELKDKLQQRTILEGAELAEAERGMVQIARLALGAGGEDAQRALPNAAALMRDRMPLDVVAAPEPVGFDDEALDRVPMLWLHGRTEFTLTEPQRESLRRFLENGGLILGSAICGSEEFADAFRREFAEILPDAPLRPISSDHPALTSRYGGYDLSSVTIRRPADSGQTLEVMRRQGPPMLEIASVDSVSSVFFSPLDLSCALESQNSIQCPGYDTEDAAKIVANLVLFGLQQ